MHTLQLLIMICACTWLHRSFPIWVISLGTFKFLEKHCYISSSLCVIKCIVKWPAWEEAQSHWSHLFDFSPCMFLNISSKRLREMIWGKVTLVAFFLTFLLCEFSYVSSNDLPEKRHSHIGCIYLFFLRCVFSYGSSKHLHRSMHSHIGCICLIFLHCAFSSVSSKRLPVKKQSRIDCICLIFLRCALSNVSSKGRHEKMHIRIGCIC